MAKIESESVTYVSPAVAAKQGGVCLQSLRRWAKAGKIPHYRTPGGHHRYCLEAVMRLRTPVVVTPAPAAPLAAPAPAMRVPAAVIPIESARPRMGQAELRQAFSALASSSNLAG